MSTTLQNPTGVYLNGLARRLVSDGILTEEAARGHQQKALKAGQALVAVLVEAKAAKPIVIAQAASNEFGVPLIDLGGIDIDFTISKDIGEKVLRKAHALPLIRRGRKIFVAVSDPTNLAA
ncbi:MAG: type IV-A pilus assembly ATPase PilB, partial [Pseudomonadota bacterium]|nr:type IV-A pilus assembly ATPase PilB [Pseudomonadota bacterium]